MPRERGEDGFILLESIVAISLITIILAALGSFTLRTVQTTSDLRARQAATQVATSTMASIAAIPATDLTTGRDVNSVNTQFTDAPASVAPSLTSMVAVSDSFAAPGAGAVAVIPTSGVPLSLNAVAFTVNSYLGRCTIASGTTTCVATGTGITHLRAVVAVTWSGRGCGNGSCSYVTATLINADNDPVFNTNTAVPPPTPTVTPPGNQRSTVSGSVNLQLSVASNSGVPPLTWAVTAGSLPPGLTLSASGLISGAPTTVAAATSLAVTVTDAFGRTGSATFTWAVLAAPTASTPATQSTTQGSAVSLAIASTCPNSPCTFSMANAPAGLSINANTGVITGNPTTIGTYATVTVTITDASAVSGTTNPFTWRVLSLPTIGNPGTLTTTITAVESVPIAYTCPAGPCTVALTGTVPGLGLSSAAANATNNTTPSLSVAAGSGIVYIAGTTQASAVTSSTSTAYAPVVRITDPSATTATSTTGAWTAYLQPTIAALGTRTMTVRTTPNIAVVYTCPNVPCTLTLAGSPTGLGLSTTAGVTTTNDATTLSLTAASGTVYVNGLIDSAAVPSGTSKVYSPTLTIADTDLVTASSSGSWTLLKGPSITNPGTQAIETSRSISLQLNATCPNTGCSTWTVAISPTNGLNSIAISNTGRITGTFRANGTYTVAVTVTDSAGISDTTNFTLIVQNFSMSVGNRNTVRPSSGTSIVTINLSSLISPTGASYTYSITSAPSWLTLDPATGLLTAAITSTSASDLSITVTAASSSSAASTVSSTFSWTLT